MPRIIWYIDTENMIPISQLRRLIRKEDRLIVPVNENVTGKLPPCWRAPDVCNVIEHFDYTEYVWHESAFEWEGCSVEIRLVGSGPQFMDDWLVSQEVPNGFIPVIVSHDYGYIEHRGAQLVYDARLSILYGDEQLVNIVGSTRAREYAILAEMPKRLENYYGIKIY